MAVGRRKSFGRGTLTTSLATLVTAGAAPADGSARATLTSIILCQTDNTARTVSLKAGPSGTTKFLYATFPIAASDTAVHNAAVDLMGTEILEGLASANSAIDWHAYGVEAKDA